MTELDRQREAVMIGFITEGLRNIGRRSRNPGPIDKILLKGDAKVFSKLARMYDLSEAHITRAIQEGAQIKEPKEDLLP